VIDRRRKRPAQGGDGTGSAKARGAKEAGGGQVIDFTVYARLSTTINKASRFCVIGSQSGSGDGRDRRAVDEASGRYKWFGDRGIVLTPVLTAKVGRSSSLPPTIPKASPPRGQRSGTVRDRRGPVSKTGRYPESG
jgi:hypothetical protein